MRNIIFDIGNVLTDFRWQEFLEDKGFSGEVLDRIAKASVLSPVWKELDRGVWSFEEVMAGFIKNDPALEKEMHMAFDDMTDIVTIRDYAVDWIRELKRKGYQVYYLSNFSDKIERECAKALVFREEMAGGIVELPAEGYVIVALKTIHATCLCGNHGDWSVGCCMLGVRLCDSHGIAEDWCFCLHRGTHALHLRPSGGVPDDFVEIDLAAAIDIAGLIAVIDHPGLTGIVGDKA